MTVSTAHRLLPTTQCRSTECGEQIAWRMTPGGARIPLDPFPNDHGNMVVNGGEARTLGTQQVAAAKSAGQPLYMPHHATCVGVKEFRR